jgi:PatG Domain
MEKSNTVTASYDETSTGPAASPVGPAVHTAGVLPSQSCPTCGAAAAVSPSPVPPSYVYAVGKIEARFPRISVEKEFAQALGRDKTAGLTDRQALQAVLSKPENRYLLRQLCWVMTIEGLETYILIPRDLADGSPLVESLRPVPTPLDLDVVIGVRTGLATPDMCNGLVVPVVIFDQIYSFDRDSLIKAIPRPEKTSAKEFAPAAEELFDRMMQMTDNAGAADEHRAVNYLALRYPAIYANIAEAFARNASLTSVDVRTSALSGIRRIVEVIFSYTNRNTDVTDKFFTRVDVTDEFPFLVNKISPYYDH